MRSCPHSPVPQRRRSNFLDRLFSSPPDPRLHHHRRFANRQLIATAVIAACLGVASCSNSELKPDRELGAVEAAITEAESAGARQADPVLLNQARMKLRLARDQIDKEQYEDAVRTLNEAKVEAQLAKARAETQAAKRATEEMETNINLLRQQINNPDSSR